MALKSPSFVGPRYFVIYCFPLRVALKISSRHGRERECGIACNDDTCKRIASLYQSTSEKKGQRERERERKNEKKYVCVGRIDHPVFSTTIVYFADILRVEIHVRAAKNLLYLQFLYFGLLRNFARNWRITFIIYSEQVETNNFIIDWNVLERVKVC
jgi:hypothetical protein